MVLLWRPGAVAPFAKNHKLATIWLSQHAIFKMCIFDILIIIVLFWRKLVLHAFLKLVKVTLFMPIVCTKKLAKTEKIR